MTIVVADRLTEDNAEQADAIAECDACEHPISMSYLMLEAWAMGIRVVCKDCLGLVRRMHNARYN